MDTNIQRIIFSKTCSVLILMTGLLLRYIIGKRRFYRRGIGGLQHYSRYWIGVTTTIIEWIFQWTANILIIGGIILLLVCLDCSKQHHNAIQPYNTIQH